MSDVTKIIGLAKEMVAIYRTAPQHVNDLAAE